MVLDFRHHSPRIVHGSQQVSEPEFDSFVLTSLVGATDLLNGRNGTIDGGEMAVS